MNISSWDIKKTNDFLMQGTCDRRSCLSSAGCLDVFRDSNSENRLSDSDAVDTDNYVYMLCSLWCNCEDVQIFSRSVKTVQDHSVQILIKYT